MLTIDKIELHPQNQRRVLGHLDAPQPGQRFDDLDFRISGWLLRPQVKKVIAYDGAEFHGSARPAIDRPDVKKAHRLTWGTRSSTPGFELHIRALRLPLAFQLRIILVLEGGEWVEFATVSGRREALQFGVETRLQPLLVNGHGRSGTTWTMNLLRRHPQITVAGDYPYEVVQSVYWANLFEMLTLTQGRQANRYLGSSQVKADGDQLVDMAMLFRAWDALAEGGERGFIRWHQDEHRRAVATFCLQRLDSYYCAIAQAQQKADTVYFAEKRASQLPLTRSLFPSRREIVLVRDPRDLLCSIYAFNQKRGFRAFKVEDFPTEQAYIARMIEAFRRSLAQLEAQPTLAHLLRYEDLVAEPRAALEKLFTFLQLDASPAVIESVVMAAANDTTNLEAHRTSASTEASVSRWKRDLSAAAQAIFREEAADVLAKLGYEQG